MGRTDVPKEGTEDERVKAGVRCNHGGRSIVSKPIGLSGACLVGQNSRPAKLGRL